MPSDRQPSRPAPGATCWPSRAGCLAVARGLLGMGRFGPIDMMNTNRGVHGINLGHLWHIADQMRAMLDTIVGLVDAGTFDPVISATFPLEKAAEAHAYIQARKNFGKVVLTC